MTKQTDIAALSAAVIAVAASTIGGGGSFDASDSIVGLGIIAFLVGFVFGYERANKLEEISVALTSGLAALPAVGALIGLSGLSGCLEWLGYLFTWAIGAIAAGWADRYCKKYRTSK